MLSLEVLYTHNIGLSWIYADSYPGVDQRKLFTAAKEWLPKIGHRQVSS